MTPWTTDWHATPGGEYRCSQCGAPVRAFVADFEVGSTVLDPCGHAAPIVIRWRSAA